MNNQEMMELSTVDKSDFEELVKECASIKQKIPLTILYILLFSVFLRLCYIREVMTHKEYDFFTAVHRTKGKK